MSKSLSPVLNAWARCMRARRAALLALPTTLLMLLAAAAGAPALARAAGAEGLCPKAPRGSAVVDWGINAAEQLGAGYRSAREASPSTVSGIEGVRQAQAGFKFSVALVGNCAPVAWGSNRQGELGSGSEATASHPVPVLTASGAPLEGIKEIAVANAHVLALAYNGTVWTWGASEFGERGNGESGWEHVALATEPQRAKPRYVAAQVEALTKEALGGREVVEVAAGGKRDYARLSNGEVLAWGDDHNGELGVEEVEQEECYGELYGASPDACSKVPRPVKGLTGVERIGAGEEAAYAVSGEGKQLFAWGNNAKGQLGDGDTESSTTPVQVELTVNSPVLQIVGGRQYALARLANGTVYGWGANGGGQLGFESRSEASETCGGAACSPIPTRAGALDHVIELAAGEANSLALKEEESGGGVIYSFGRNGSDELLGLGEASFGQESLLTTPTPIMGLASVTSISVSSTTGIAVLESGHGPPPRLTVTPQTNALGVSWLFPGEAFKLRYREVDAKKYSPTVEVGACDGEASCDTYTFQQGAKEPALKPEPYEVTVNTGARNSEGKIVIVKSRHIIGTPLPAPGSPVSRSLPTITGAPPIATGKIREGQTLTASPGSWQPSASEFSYSWLRCEGLGENGSTEELGTECEPIETGETVDAEGETVKTYATGPEYKPQPADLAHTLVVRVEAKNASGWSAAVSEPQLVLGAGEESEPLPPVETTPPVISGSAQVAGNLQVAHGSWEGEPTRLEDKWFHCRGRIEEGATEGTGGSCGPITRENPVTHKQEPVTGSSWVPSEEYVGKWVEVQERASNTGGFNTATSQAVEVTPAAVPANLALPKIAGTLESGQTLTVEEGTWTNAAETPLWQWLRCEGATCVKIEKATKSTYKLVTADIGHSLEVTETVKNAIGPSLPATALPTETVLPPAAELPKSVTLPTLEGGTQQGETLKVRAGTWANNPTKIVEQWRRCDSTGKNCKLLAGQTRNEYTLLAEDVGHTIGVTEKASNAAGATSAPSAVSAVVKGAVPVVSSAPAITGIAQQGQALTETHGSWSNEPTGYEYQWLRCERTGGGCEPILGATGREYEPRREDVGFSVRVQETAFNATGRGMPANSAPSTEILPAAPTVLAPPVIAGAPYVAQTLSAERGVWANEPSGYSYQWLSCEAGACRAIEGATTPTYTLTAADLGRTIELRETARNAGGWNSATTLGTSPITMPPPVLGGVAPGAGPLEGGTSVTISGANFAEASAVRFGSAPATSFKVLSSGSISAVAPAGSGIVDVTVTTPYGTSAVDSADRFTYVPPPVVSAVEPASGPVAGGSQVTIRGENLGEVSTVDFGFAAASEVHVVSPTTVTAVAPLGQGIVDVTVTTPFGTSAINASDRFTYVPPPSVVRVEPATSPLSGGGSVTLSGENLAGASGVHFGSTAAVSFKVISAQSISAVAPAGSGTVDVTVTTPFGTSATGAADRFSYVPPPVIDAVEPAAGPLAGGNSVTISGANLAEASAVRFGSAAAVSYTVLSAGSISAAAPAGSGSVDVTVTTPYGTSATGSSDTYSYLAPPTVSAVSPGKGPVEGETAVTITGTGFSNVTGVSFGSQAARFAVASPTTITATAPAGAAGTIDVTVTTLGGTSATSSKDRYSYAPTVTGVSPSGGTTSGGNLVTITGTGFAPGTAATSVKFDKTEAAGVNCSSSTQCTAIAPAGSAGTVDVQVTVNKSTSAKVKADRYTYS